MPLKRPVHHRRPCNGRRPANRHTDGTRSPPRSLPGSASSTSSTAGRVRRRARRGNADRDGAIGVGRLPCTGCGPASRTSQLRCTPGSVVRRLDTLYTCSRRRSGTRTARRRAVVGIRTRSTNVVQIGNTATRPAVFSPARHYHFRRRGRRRYCCRRYPVGASCRRQRRLSTSTVWRR